MTDEADDRRRGEDAPPPSPQPSDQRGAPPGGPPFATATAGRGDRSRLPFILIGLGLLILLLNLGWFGGLFGGLFSLVRLWPVALIAIGADMITNGRYRLIIVIAAVVVGLGLLASWQRPGALRGSGDVQLVDVPLDGANRIELRLETGVADLDLGSQPRGSSALSGEIVRTSAEAVNVDFRRSGGTLDIEVVSRSQRGPFGFIGLFGNAGSGQGGWDLALAEGLPTDIDVDSGVGRVDFDLSRVDLRSFELDAGVGATNITFPRGAFEASIDGGVGAITLLLPAGAPVRIDVDTGIGSVDIDGSFERSGDTYTSAAYRGGGGGARIDIDVGVGQVRVRTVP